MREDKLIFCFSISMDSSIQFSQIPDASYLQLFWNEFFASRGRGISIEAHFPWIVDPDYQKSFILARGGGRVCAGLVLRDRPHSLGTRIANVAEIGLVCVRHELRGKGLGTQIMNAAINHSRSCGIDAITLWASKHSFYEQLGFRLADPSLFGWVRNSSRSSHHVPLLRPLPKDLALPPFAHSAGVLTYGETSCRVLLDAAGAIVADYVGAPSKVADLLEHEMPSEWRLNSFCGDPLISEMNSRGFNLGLSAVNLQMWMPLSSDTIIGEVTEHSRFAVFDRI